MKRMHVHVSVENLADSIRFYSALFSAQPVVAKDDYAKWMLDDPRVNFAISQRGHQVGVDHLGIQVESEEELNEMNTRLDSAALPKETQTGTACCYASAYSGERDRQFRRNVTVAHGWVLRGSDCRRGGHDELFFSSYFRVFRSVTA